MFETWQIQRSQPFLIAEPLQTGYHSGSYTLELFHLQFIIPQSRMPDHHVPVFIVLNSLGTVVSSRQVNVAQTNPNICDAFLTTWECIIETLDLRPSPPPKSFSSDIDANETRFISY